MYQHLKRLLFCFEPEEAHKLAIQGLKWLDRVWGAKMLAKSLFQLEDPRLERKVFGLTFKNPIGLAAGFDKNATAINEMSQLGFGFIEIGTVTPLPQPGNDKPRLFRLPDDQALINRMGFNNQGVDVIAHRLSQLKRNRLIIGGNIGKNKTTSNENAINDYLICFEHLFDLVDYFVVNVSSPNTPGLRELQEKAPLMHILNTLQSHNNKKGIARPILLKIAPDLSYDQLDDIIEIVQETGIAGIIATNTTLSRDKLQAPTQLSTQIGGLSGKPLSNRATEVIRYLSTKSNQAFPIIGVGGIHSASDALEKLEAGASLIQLYTGFVYEGPSLVKRILKQILRENPPKK